MSDTYATNLSDGKSANEKIYFTFVVFPPSEYWMGSLEGESDRQADERLHRVRLTRPLAVCSHEVSWEQYDPADGAQTHRAQERQYGRQLTPAEPAFGVNWFEAVAYCRWLTTRSGWSEAEQCYIDPEPLEKGPDGNPQQWPVHLDRSGFRLPTEAEWEYACRSGMRTAYGFGNDVSRLTYYAWFQDNSQRWSHSRGQLRPNIGGLFDVHGNLFEWCCDWYDVEPPGDAVDPMGATGGTRRVFRGGGWYVPARDCQSADRNLSEPNSGSCFLGFRVALDVAEKAEPPKEGK